MFTLLTSTTFIRHFRQTLFTLCRWQCRRTRKQTITIAKKVKQLATGNVIYKRNTEMLNNYDDVTNNTDVEFVWVREIDRRSLLFARPQRQTITQQINISLSSEQITSQSAQWDASTKEKSGDVSRHYFTFPVLSHVSRSCDCSAVFRNLF